MQKELALAKCARRGSMLFRKVGLEVGSSAWSLWWVWRVLCCCTKGVRGGRQSRPEKKRKEHFEGESVQNKRINTKKVGSIFDKIKNSEGVPAALPSPSDFSILSKIGPTFSRSGFVSESKRRQSRINRFKAKE